MGSGWGAGFTGQLHTLADSNGGGQETAARVDRCRARCFERGGLISTDSASVGVSCTASHILSTGHVQIAPETSCHAYFFITTW